jgi:tetratricopeptide (TPR) repeat protein
VLEGLASLVDKSLVLSEEDGEGGHRFRLLESVRDLALEQGDGLRRRRLPRGAHTRYFLQVAERAAPELVGPAQRAWFLRLEQEHGNLRAALRWLWDHGENQLALRLAGALGYFWEVRGYLREGQQALEEALARMPDSDPRLRARVLNRLGSLLIWQDAERSGAVIEQALALGRELSDPDITARSLSQLGRLAAILELAEERLREAVQLLNEALALWQQRGDRRGAANARTQLAGIALRQGEYERAEHLAEEALAAYREAGDDAWATVPLALLGLAAGEQGDTARAAALMQQGLQASSHLLDRRLLLLEASSSSGGSRPSPETRSSLRFSSGPPKRWVAPSGPCRLDGGKRGHPRPSVRCRPSGRRAVAGGAGEGTRSVFLADHRACAAGAERG